MSEKPKKIAALFTWRSAIARSHLQPSTRHVLLTLSLHMNELGESCFPSTKLLAEETGLSERCICTQLEHAEISGWLMRRERKGAPGRWASNEYMPKIPSSTFRPAWADFPPTKPAKKGRKDYVLNVVSKAVSEDKLKKGPCRACGSENVQAHHWDYDKPLDVVWLCHKHHGQIHWLEKLVERGVNMHEEGQNPTERGSVGKSPVPTEPHADPTERGSVSPLNEVQCSTSESTSESTSRKRDPDKDHKDRILPDCINRNDWIDFVDSRRTVKKPLTKQAADRIVKKLEGFHANGHSVSEILSTSIESGWSGVFEPKRGIQAPTDDDPKNKDQPLQRRFN